MSLNVIEKHIELNVSQPNNYEIVHIMQGTNNTVKIIADIYDGNVAYTINAKNLKLCITDGATSNQHVISLPCTVRSDKQSVELTIDENISDYNGDVYLSIAFEDDNGDAVYTYPFIVRVTGTPIGDAQKEDISGILEIVDRVENAVQATTNLYNKLMAEKGSANGIATLDENTKVPRDELYVATTSTTGITQLTDSVTSNSTSTAATPNSVKTVNDKVEAMSDEKLSTTEPSNQKNGDFWLLEYQ